MTDLPAIDWDLAARLGATTAPKGPRVRRAERAAAVADLRRLSDQAHPLAVAVTGLPDPCAPIPTQVVGRGRWIQLTVATGEAMMREVGLAAEPGDSLWRTVQARALAAQVGPVLGWLSGKIVGQFDPYGARPTMLMVAPNVLQIERELDVDPRDFRLWVLVHEQTHRLQFHAAPWLREHLVTLMREAVATGLGQAEGDAPADARRASSLVDLLSGPQQRAVITKVTALMSVLEGYAEVMMDSVGTDVIPTVEQIRARFQTRRERGGLDAVLRRLLGMETKLAQYREGAAFCRAVIARVGVDGLNRVYESPGTMPSYEELTHPEQWLARVHPGA